MKKLEICCSNQLDVINRSILLRNFSLIIPCSRNTVIYLKLLMITLLILVWNLLKIFLLLMPCLLKMFFRLIKHPFDYFQHRRWMHTNYFSFKLTKNEINHVPVKTFILGTGTFPDAFKLARITWLYKKGEENIPDNYRPINSLPFHPNSLPFVSKIFERCVASRFMIYFNDNSIISKTQFGFQRGLSTVHALECLAENIYVYIYIYIHMHVVDRIQTKTLKSLTH